MMMRRVPTGLYARCGGSRGIFAELIYRPAIIAGNLASSDQGRSFSVAVLPGGNNHPTAPNRHRSASLASSTRTCRDALFRYPRLLSSSTPASLLGDDGFDPFVTHHNAKDADRADRMVRDYVKRRLAGGSGIEIRQDFLRGALNSYRVLSEKAAKQARRGGKRRPDVSFAQKADELLAFVEQSYSQDPALSTDTKSYAMVVDAYAKIGDPEHAEAVLMRLEKLWKSGNKEVKPNTIVYGAVLDAWAKSREKGAAQRAAAILDHMLKLHEAGQEDCRPNTICFNSVIDAWARSRDAAAPQRAEALLEKMEELYRQGNKDVCPGAVSYSAVINAWAKSREKGAAQRAEAILNQMLELCEGGREECRPNDISFTAVIDAWAKSRDADAPRRAEVLLEKMEEMYRHGNGDVCPNTVSYSAVINAWAKSREKGAARRANDILNHMIKLQEAGREDCGPNTTTFNTVIDAWAKSREKGAAQRAEAILNHMLKLYEGGREECRPDSVSFTAVIDAWAKGRDQNAYELASKLFQQMQSMGRVAEPNSMTYSALINALAVGSVPDKAAKAFNILLEMEEIEHKGKRDVAPTTITYGAVMKACARTSGNREAKRKALRVALEAFDKLRRSSHLSSANPMMYDSLFITIANASKGSEYAKLVSQIFKFCCEDGALNNYILRNLRRNSPRDVFEKMIGSQGSGGRDVSVADLPPEWSRNVKRR